MNANHSGPVETVARELDRRRAVLLSALETFSRFGYSKTSMDDVARAAHISRPGLYFLFDSKPVLFREAVTYVLDRDLGSIELELGDTERPLSERMIAAFDIWAGSHIGPLTDTPDAVATNAALLGPLLNEAPRRFEELVIRSVRQAKRAGGIDRARTLISTSIGIKQQVSTRAEYLERFRIAVALVLPDPQER